MKQNLSLEVTFRFFQADENNFFMLCSHNNVYRYKNFSLHSQILICLLKFFFCLKLDFCGVWNFLVYFVVTTDRNSTRFSVMRRTRFFDGHYSFIINSKNLNPKSRKRNMFYWMGGGWFLTIYSRTLIMHLPWEI